MSNYDYWNEDAIGYEDSISHHGILGQKWGVRRYQNDDGSLTSAGKKRYANLGSRVFNSMTNQVRKNSYVFNKHKENVLKKRYESDSSAKNKKAYENQKENTKVVAKKTAKKVATAAAIGAAAGIGLAVFSTTKVAGLPSLAGGGKSLPGIAQLPDVANRYVNTIAE